MFYVWVVSEKDDPAAQWTDAAAAYRDRFGMPPAYVAMRAEGKTPEPPERRIVCGVADWPLDMAWYMAAPVLVDQLPITVHIGGVDRHDYVAVEHADQAPEAARRQVSEIGDRWVQNALSAAANKKTAAPA